MTMFNEVDMNATITKVGIDYLRLEYLAGNLGQFSGFQFGSSNVMDVTDTLTSVAGTVTYFGIPAEMTYAKIGPHEASIKCVIDHDKGDFDIGSFALLVGPSVPFMVGKLPYVHKKQKTRDTDIGGRFTLQVRFVMYDLYLNWSFANLTTRYATFNAEEDHIDDIPAYPASAKDLMYQVDTVPFESGRRGYALYPGTMAREWRAPDLQMRHDDPDFFRFDGGVDGDGHQYTP